MDSIAPILHTKLFLVTALITVIYMYFKFVIYGYWKRRGIPHAPPIIPVGNAFPLISGKVSIGNLMRQKYNEGKKYPVYGIYMFHKPILLINDPNVIQLILIKEFNKFRNRGLYFNDKVDTLSLNLFFLPGERWRQLRTKLTPTFTSGKLKQMYPLLLEIGDNLTRVCDRIINKDNIVEFKDLIGRYTTDTISSMAFGVDCQSLDNGSSEFQKHGSMAFDLPPSKNALAVFAPIILDIFRIPVFNNKITQFFVKTFNDVLEERRRNKITRKDFLNSLMQLLDKGSLDEDKDLKQEDNSENGSALGKISLSEAIGQAFIFYLAGFETTSSTITYCLYELSLNPEIQEKVQAEIDEFSKRDGGIAYEIISNDMKYLHMVCLETLRKHPSIPFLNRECIEDCDIPNMNFRIEKGTKLLICMNAMHRDPDIFPDPEKFDPLRFTKENIASRQPYTYLPFGDGPRACIGIRFGMLQTKIALIGLLFNYNFSVCEKTSIPVMYARRSFTQTPENGLYLKMEKRNKSTFLYKNNKGQ